MSRAQIIALSVVCCAFGVLSLRGPEEYRELAYTVNVLLALAAFFFAGRDLTARGWRFGYLIAATYVLPLLGLLVYVGCSERPPRERVSG